MQPGFGEQGHYDAAGRDDRLCPFFQSPSRRRAELFEHVVAHRRVLESAIEHGRALNLHPVDRYEPARQTIGENIFGGRNKSEFVDQADRVIAGWKSVGGKQK